MITAEILASSRHPCGHLLTTFLLTYPRFIHAEFMTHRCKSANAASSRAIPISKMIGDVAAYGNTVVEHWGLHQPGMGADRVLDGDALKIVQRLWCASRDAAMHTATAMCDLNLAKQVANRLLEPFAHITVIATFPEIGLRNFFGLRAHPAAQPEFQKLAFAMLRAWLDFDHKPLQIGQWHVPMTTDEDVAATDTRTLLKVATGRIARVSYLTHDGKRDLDADVQLHNRLADAGHWSPFEHCARACTDPLLSCERSNFGSGWLQYRKTFEKELQQPSDTELRARLNEYEQS